MKRIVAAVAIGIIALFSATNIQAQTTVDPAHLLVPGKAMGLVQFGMSLDEVKKILGQPAYTHKNPKMDWYYFGSPDRPRNKMSGVGVWIAGGKVIGARTFEGAYRTAEGLGVGSTLAELIAVYGTPQYTKADTYNFNQVVHINELYVEWGSKGVSAHIDQATQKVAFFDIDTPK